MPRLLVHHRTVYRYARPVAFGDHHFLLRPRDAFDQRTVSYELGISPRPQMLRYRTDPVGNAVGLARFDGTADELVFDARFEVEQRLTELRDLAALDAASRRWPPAYSRDELVDLSPYMTNRGKHAKETSGAPLFDGEPAPHTDPVGGWVRGIIADAMPADAIAFLATLTHRIRESFEYKRRERGLQTPAETLALRRGTCRDFAVLFVAAARAQGFAARFVTGYVGGRQAGDVPTGGGATHAWAQVYLNQGGWIDFDPTNAIVGNRGLVRVASVREPGQASPLWGSYFGADSVALGMEVSVAVSLLDEAEPVPQEPVRTPLLAAS